jgi:hypothetical protein
MNIYCLKDPNLLEISTFLDFEEIIAFSHVSSLFRRFFTKYQSSIKAMCFDRMGLPNRSDFIDWQKIYYQTKSTSTKHSSHLYPYYTDGGTHANSNVYFIHNLIKDNRAYCTVTDRNVLVKYGFGKSLPEAYARPVSSFQRSNTIFSIDEIESNAEQLIDEMPFIEKVIVRCAIGGYTCPVKVLMCFSSYDKIEDFSFIQNFHSCDKEEAVLKVAESLQLQTTVKRVQDNITQVYFKRTSGKIQPLCWVIINITEDFNRLQCVIDIEPGIFAKYFYGLLIGATRLGNFGNNIDISELNPKSKLITLRNTNPE